MSDAHAAHGTATLPAGELYGLVAEFTEPDQVSAAAEAAHAEGYRVMDAYTPYAVEGLDEKLGMKPTRLGWLVLGAGITGAVGAFLMQWYANAIFYPLNVGGRPLNSWPNFIVITFELAVLLSSFTAGLFMIGRSGMPRPYHSIFNTPNFRAASRDRFFLSIEARDPRFDVAATRAFLEDLGPVRVSEVER